MYTTHMIERERGTDREKETEEKAKHFARKSLESFGPSFKIMQPLT